MFVEGRARGPDLAGVWLRTYALPTDWGLLIHGLDGSKQKQLEQRLARALEERDVMFNGIADKVMVLNRQWQFVYANDRAKRDHAKGIVGKFYQDVFAPGSIFEQKYRQAFETRQVVTFEAIMTVGNRWGETRVYPSREGIAIFSSDIDDRKRLEKALEQALADKENILNSITDSVIVLDRDWRFVYVNNNVSHFKPSIVGKLYWDIYPHNRGTLFEHYYQQVFETGQPARFTVRTTQSKLWTEVRVFPSPEGIAVYVADISELKAKEDALEQALAAKEMLLKEVHHRTTNNMQLISSMSSIQIHSLTDEDSRRAVAESRDRINVLADVHKLMYQQLDSETINTDTHLRGLLQKLTRSMSKREVTVDTDIAAIELTIHQAIPLGLIVNELFTNALKHAFVAPNPDDVIAVRLWLEQDHIVLEVADNGVGLPADFDTNQDTLGMTIIQSLAGQLIGEWTLTNGNQGTVARVRFGKENGQPED